MHNERRIYYETDNKRRAIGLCRSSDLLFDAKYVDLILLSCPFRTICINGKVTLGLQRGTKQRRTAECLIQLMQILLE